MIRIRVLMMHLDPRVANPDPNNADPDPHDADPELYVSRGFAKKLKLTITTHPISKNIIGHTKINKIWHIQTLQREKGTLTR